MEPLRLTLIIAGVVVLLAIIVFGRKSSKRRDFAYNSPSSKEFSFGSKPGGVEVIESVSDALAGGDMPFDDDVIVLPRKQKESDMTVGVDESVDKFSVNIHPDNENVNTQNGYKIKARSQVEKNTQVEKSTAVNEFRAFQTPENDGQLGDDVFADESNTLSASNAGIDVKRNAEETLRPNTSVEKVIGAAIDASPDLLQESSVSLDAAKREPSFKTDIIVDEKSDLKINLKSNEKVIEKANDKTLEKTIEKPGAEKLQQNKPQVTATKPKQVNATTTEKFVVLHVIAAEGIPFNGLDILDATKTLGLAFGKHAIFHYPMSAAPAGDSKFCLVNMSSEGNFETNKISSLETNGISLIMRLPIRGADALTVFSNMLGVSQALARKLGGEILDQTRMPLTAEIVSMIRADIAHFEKMLKLTESGKEPVAEV